MSEPVRPRLVDESRWYTEHTALLITTVKWALLGAIAGICVGGGTRFFLWALGEATRLTHQFVTPSIREYYLLPLALPAGVWIIRHLAPAARGHGTEAMIAAVHQRSGKVDWQVAPVKLLATIVTLALGGSVGKEGPCAQIGAAITSLFADILRANDEGRRPLVIWGIGAGFAAVFGTPVSGALFGIEVLYLGRICSSGQKRQPDERAHRMLERSRGRERPATRDTRRSRAMYPRKRRIVTTDTAARSGARYRACPSNR